MGMRAIGIHKGTEGAPGLIIPLPNPKIYYRDDFISARPLDFLKGYDEM